MELPATSALEAHNILPTRYDTQASSPNLLGLPLEMREKIYGYALVEPSLWDKRHQVGCSVRDLSLLCERPLYRTKDDAEDGAARRWERFFQHPRSRGQYPSGDSPDECRTLCRARKGLNLRLASKQIHAETEKLFWKKNVLCYSELDEMILDVATPAGFHQGRSPHKRRSIWVMPESVKQKIQRLSHREPQGWVEASSTERNCPISALKGMPNLVALELPLSILAFALTDVVALKLPCLSKLRAGHIMRVNAGYDQARVDLYFPLDFIAPPNKPTLKERVASLHAVPEWYSQHGVRRSIDGFFEVELGLRQWKEFPRSWYLRFAKGKKLPLHPEDGEPHATIFYHRSLHYRQVAQVYGLPTDPKTRCRAQGLSAAKLPGPALPRTPRQQRNEQEARYEAQRVKDVKEQKRDALNCAMASLALDKKASRKRINRPTEQLPAVILEDSRAPDRRRASRFDNTENLREEIEERTRNGETCKQIADALAAKGVNVSDKTISRRRVEWGLRKRAFRAGYTPPTPNSVRKPWQPRLRVLGEEISLVGKQNGDYRKEEIHRLTNEGKTADEIVALLTEQGVSLKSGASTIWRLQTYWKLIPYDPDRANGRGKYATYNRTPKAPKPPKVPKAKASKLKYVATPADPTTHYPVNCSFGPFRRIGAQQYDSPYPESSHGGAANTADEPIHIDSEPGSDSDADAGTFAMPDAYTPQSVDTPFVPIMYTHNQHESESSVAHPGMQTAEHAAGLLTPASQPPAQPPVAPTTAQSMNLMSAELLVDLATTALAAANKHKDLMLAVQSQRPAPGSLGVLPPSAEDVATARRKFVEAAKVAMDLAMDAPS
ncbi:hypothetical protein LTR08_007244 [Meristemomyces frigidus]|nr:hypothetical protein LTR08_007244 [Meristemomyces frigidus]